MGSNSSQEAIGKRIAELRQKNNLTQSELASKLCVSREMINYWEKGSRDIKTGNIVLLSEVLNTTCDYLLQGIEPNSTTNNVAAIKRTTDNRALKTFFISFSSTCFVTNSPVCRRF